MAAGMALWEQYKTSNGLAKTCDFSDYRIPRSTDIPLMDIEFLPTPDPSGPFGAKGLGEPAMVAAGPAILNAVCDALDYDFSSVPVTRDMILKAFRNR